MKTTSQVFRQYHKLAEKNYKQGMAAIKKADPITGGYLNCVSNWGNLKSKRLLERMENRNSWLMRAYHDLYDKAEHYNNPWHEEFKPLWCKYCEKDTSKGE